jgi:hypothetical protein
MRWLRVGRAVERRRLRAGAAQTKASAEKHRDLEG